MGVTLFFVEKIYLFSHRSLKVMTFLAVISSPRGVFGGKYFGEAKKLTNFLVVALKTQAKPTKSTTPTLKNAPCLQVLLLHTAAVIKDLVGAIRLNLKPRLFSPLPSSHVVYLLFSLNSAKK